MPCAGMMVFDQLNFEITQIEASYFGPKAQAAHISVATTVTFIFMISIGLSISSSVIIGNLVGKGDSNAAKVYSSASALLVVLIIGTLDFMVVILREQLSHAYTYDDEVAEMIAELLIPAMLFNFLDSIQVVLCGILKGIAQQSNAFYCLLLSYYVFALPVGYILSFYWNFGILGIWYGLLLGAILAALSLLIVLRKSLWIAKTITYENEFLCK